MNTSKAIKTFIFAALFLLSGILFWKSLADIYLKGDLSASSFIWFGATLLVWLIFFLFFSLLVENKGIFLLIYLIFLVGFFIFFPFHYFLLIGLAVLFLIFILSRSLMQKERNDRLKISLKAIFRRGLTFTLVFLALFISLVDYFHPLIKVGKDGINLPPQVLEWILKPVSGTLNKALPVFDANMTVNEMLSMNTAIQSPDLSAIAPELLTKFKGKKLSEINPQELLKDPVIVEALKNQAKKVNQQALVKQRDDLSKSLGIALTGNEKFSEVINKLTSKQLQGLLGPYLPYLPIVSAIITFLVLTSIFWPFSWIVILVSLLIFKIFLIFRIVHKEKVMKEGEDVRI